MGEILGTIRDAAVRIADAVERYVAHRVGDANKPPAEEVVDGWKTIASELGVSVRTAQTMAIKQTLRVARDARGVWTTREAIEAARATMRRGYLDALAGARRRA